MRTLGIPTRSFDRESGGLEGVVSNNFGNVWKNTFGFLELGFDDAHFVDVFEQSLGAGVAADDTLPSLLERYLAPCTSLAARELYIDERSTAIALAPAAHRVLVRRAAIVEVFDGVVTPESGSIGTAGVFKRA